MKLEDIAKLIDSDKGFAKFEKEGYSVVGYLHNGAFHHSDITSKKYLEMRFIKFDDSGKCICRPMEKFFNFGDGLTEKFWPEFEDYNPHNWLIGPKLDGSLINPVVLNGKLLFMSKMGEHSEVAIQFSEWMESWAAAGVMDVLKKVSEKYTINMEYISPNNRIVCKYKYTKAIITGARNIETGDYVPQEDVKKLLWPLLRYPECVEFVSYENLTDKYNGHSVNDIVESLIRKEEEIEGYILVHKSGFPRLKVKTDWYLERHGEVDNMFRFYNIVRFDARRLMGIILEDKFDDILARVSQEAKELFEKRLYDFDVWYSVSVMSHLRNIISKAKGMTSKEYAQSDLKKTTRYSLHSLVFKFIQSDDDLDIDEFVMDNIDEHMARYIGSMGLIESIQFWNREIGKWDA